MTDEIEKSIKALDTSDMLSKILEFPDQILRGWDIAGEARVTMRFNKHKHVVFCGMGGSAIAGDIVRLLYSQDIPIPFVVHRGYKLPGFVDSQSLFIASSYSGNTEETLTSTNAAVDAGCSILCITSGGKLMAMAQEKGYPVCSMPTGYPPRGALGYSLGVLFHLFHHAGVEGASEKTIKEAVSFIKRTGEDWLKTHTGNCLPLRLAETIKGKLPLIYSSVERTEAVGLRWKAQFNENSKTHAFYQAFPEMNHNEIMGWNGPSGTQPFYPHLIMLLLRDPEDSSRIGLRMDVTRRLLETSGAEVLEVWAQGPSVLSRVLYLIYLGDLVSFYLAILYGVDPTEIQNIDRLKKELARSS
jgi:glucose/mannose-6-phosphate isomerase